MPHGQRTTRRFLGRAAVLALALTILALTDARTAAADDKHPQVVLDTSMGSITLELDATKAPITVENFLKYVKSGYYNGLIFHRVIDKFMIQGGGFTPSMVEKREGQLNPIANEAGVSNVRGTIAMARTSDPNSATSQFFINLVDNRANLDKAPGSAGYAVFGKVIEGMDVVDKIAKVQTRNVPPHSDVPVEAVVIRSAKVKS